MKRLVLFVLLVVVAGQAQTAEKIQTGFITGSTLLESCSTPIGDFRSGECLGYVMAIVELHSSLVDSNLLQPMTCLPTGETGVTTGQLVLVAKKYLQEHPEYLHYAAPSLVMNAFTDAFPCK